MADMVLATPVMRGKSDVITNYEEGATISEGQAFSLDANGNMIPFDGSKPLKGVAAYAEADKRRAGIEAAKGVAVPVGAADTIVPGTQAYYDATAKAFTSDNTKTETKAVFMSEKGDAVNARTGATVSNCALIDFVGGF